MIFPNATAAETVRSYFERRVLCVGSRRQTPRGATDIYAANRQPGKEEIVEPEETIAYQPITCTVSFKYNCHGIPSSLVRKAGKDARSSDLYSRAQVRPQHASPSHCGWSPSHTTTPYLGVQVTQKLKSTAPARDY